MGKCPSMKVILADPEIKKALISISPTSRQNQLISQMCYPSSRWVRTSPGLIANSAYSGRYLWMVADWH
jgi:hypothetical protein